MSTPTLREELRDAIAPRTVALVVAVLLLELGFVLSYVGAFHRPAPHEVPVTVVAPVQQLADQTAAALDGVDGTPLEATASTDEAAARAALTDDATSGVLVVDPTSTTDTLFVATAGGASTATAVQAVLTQADATQGRTLTVQDVVPAADGDARGLTGFYLLVVGPLLGALPDGTATLLALTGTGTLVVLAAAAVTMALQVLAGVIGIGLAVLLFVVLGNPSAGGAYQPVLLPPFWAWLSGVLPNGAATDAVRRFAYFDGASTAQPLLVVAAWAVVGAAVALVGARWHARRADLP